MAMPARADSRDRRPADKDHAAGHQASAAALQERGQVRRAGSAAELREITDVLGKLAELRASGALTDTEFTEQKRRLLGARERWYSAI